MELLLVINIKSYTTFDFPLISVCLEPPGVVVVLVAVASCLDSPLLPFLASQGPIDVTLQRMVQIHFKLRYIFVCLLCICENEMITYKD